MKNYFISLASLFVVFCFQSSVFAYTASAPLTWNNKSNMTISGDSITNASGVGALPGVNGYQLAVW